MLWNHPILGSHNPQTKLISFERDDDLGYWYCEIYPDMTCFIVNENDQIVVFTNILDKMSQRVKISKISDTKFSNEPLHMPRGANYLNENIFSKLAFYGKICIGKRQRPTNQFIEGSFCGDKHQEIEAECGAPADEYAKSEINTLDALNMAYIKECQNACSKQIKNQLDHTNTNKIVLSNREKRIFRQFDKFIEIIQKGNYNRKKAVIDYYKYYSQKKNVKLDNDTKFNLSVLGVPPMEVGKISVLKGGTKKLSDKQNYIAYVEHWLTDRVGPEEQSDDDL